MRRLDVCDVRVGEPNQSQHQGECDIYHLCLTVELRRIAPCGHTGRRQPRVGRAKVSAARKRARPTGRKRPAGAGPARTGRSIRERPSRAGAALKSGPRTSLRQRKFAESRSQPSECNLLKELAVHRVPRRHSSLLASFLYSRCRTTAR